MKNRIIKTVILSVLFGNLGFSQSADSLKTRPGQVSFFYPLGTNGIESPSYTNNVSFNVFYGYNGGFNGIEIGGLANVNKGDVNGFQLAGIANVNGKSANAIMFGGIANIVKDSSNAMCFAGIANLIGGNANGMQFAGISNTVNGDVNGGQFAGILNTVNGNTIGIQSSGISNINTGNMVGVQAAGISNVNGGDLIGMQVSGITNVLGGDITGGQLGLMNRAKSVQGFQIGLINFASSYSKGVPLGLFSWVTDGYHALELAGGESVYGNANLKIGVEKLYTIYKFGYTADGSENHFSYGLGLGTMLGISEKTALSFDLSCSQLVRSTYSPEWNFLSKADLSFRYKLGKHFDVFAGPSFNVYTTTNSLNSENSALKIANPLYEENWWNNNGSTTLFFGGNAGVSFKF